MPPYQYGGEMIKNVSFKKTTYNNLPFKFEAGTPNISGVIGLGAAIKYINKIGIENIQAQESDLLKYATKKVLNLPWVKIIGTAKNKTSILSFNIQNIHPYDAGVIIDKMGIAIRTGTHCAQPLMDKLQISGTIRASFAFYNTKEEIDKLIESVKKVNLMINQK